jgi:hypothetical protein
MANKAAQQPEETIQVSMLAVSVCFGLTGNQQDPDQDNSDSLPDKSYVRVNQSKHRRNKVSNFGHR